MRHFVIIATHHLKSGHRQSWAALAQENAVQARQEPGCLQFDVVLPRGEPDTGILIEKYRDEDAWNWHFRQPYCQRFMAAAEGILRERTRKLCELFGLPEEGS